MTWKLCVYLKECYNSEKTKTCDKPHGHHTTQIDFQDLPLAYTFKAPNFHSTHKKNYLVLSIFTFLIIIIIIITTTKSPDLANQKN